jgi:predicted HD phosphohydrolase
MDPLTILASRGNRDYIGENVTQVEHALQTAYYAICYATTLENPLSTKSIGLVVASLFHDIGHLLESRDFGLSAQLKEMSVDEKKLGVDAHEKVGADYLRERGGLFSRFPIPELIQGHVPAKRYMVTCFPGYTDKLSEASKMTLLQQGGYMTPEEVEEFVNDNLKCLKIKLRQFDDLAKAVDAEYGYVSIKECLIHKNKPQVVPNLESHKEFLLGLQKRSTLDKLENVLAGPLTGSKRKYWGSILSMLDEKDEVSPSLNEHSHVLI